jgi:carboxylate-amine ligase
MMVSQNKWRAARFGTSARLVDNYTFETYTVAEVVDQLIQTLQPTADELGCVVYLERCRTIAASPTWADRQVSLLRQHGEPRAMVRQLVEEARISPAPA